MLPEEIDLFALRLTLSMRERVALWLEIWIKSESAFISRPGGVLLANTLVMLPTRNAGQVLLFTAAQISAGGKRPLPSPRGRFYAAGGDRMPKPLAQGAGRHVVLGVQRET